MPITLWDILKVPYTVPKAAALWYYEGLAELGGAVLTEYQDIPQYQEREPRDVPVVRRISTGEYPEIEEWARFGAWSDDYEIFVYGAGWVSSLSQAGRLAIARAIDEWAQLQLTGTLVEPAGPEGVLGQKYGPVSSLEVTSPGIWTKYQPYSFFGLGAAVPVALYDFWEAQAEALAAYRLGEERKGESEMVTLGQYGEVSAEPVGVPSVPPAPATSDPTEPITGGGLAPRTLLAGGAAAAAAAFALWMAQRKAADDRAPKLDARKAALTGAMLAAGWLPLPAGTTAKHPRKWWHPVSGQKVTLPGKRRRRGISAGDVKTVKRVERSFKSLAKSLGYVFSSGGRGTVRAAGRGTGGRFKKGGKHRHSTK